MKKVTPRYKIGDKLLVSETKKEVIIEDYEVFNDLILYYTNDNSAYPQEKLISKELDGIVEFFTRSDEDWKKLNDDFFKKHNLQ